MLEKGQRERVGINFLSFSTSAAVSPGKTHESRRRDGWVDPQGQFRRLQTT